MRSLGSIRIGGNILSLDFSRSKASDANIAIIANFVNLRKTRVKLFTSDDADLFESPYYHAPRFICNVYSEVQIEQISRCLKGRILCIWGEGSLVCTVRSTVADPAVR